MGRTGKQYNFTRTSFKTHGWTYVIATLPLDEKVFICVWLLFAAAFFWRLLLSIIDFWWELDCSPPPLPSYQFATSPSSFQNLSICSPVPILKATMTVSEYETHQTDILRLKWKTIFITTCLDLIIALPCFKNISAKKQSKSYLPWNNLKMTVGGGCLHPWRFQKHFFIHILM